MTLAQLLQHIDWGNIKTASEALPEVIGDNALFVNTATGEQTGVDGGEHLDIGRLLAVIEAALKAHDCVAANEAGKILKAQLLALARQAVDRALWVSEFDPTNPDHMK